MERKRILDRRRLHSAIFLGIVAAMFALAAAGFYPGIFLLFGIPAQPPIFADSHVITAALDTFRAGGDPLVSSPQAPGALSFNYPRVWLLLADLGITAKDTKLLAIILDLMFAGTVIAILERVATRRDERNWVLALAVSPMCFFLMERGNSDCAVLGLTAVAVLSVGRRPVAAWLALIFAFVLKLFPIFAMLIFAAKRRKVFWIATGCGVVFAAAVVTVTFRDIALVSHNTPRPQALSYGREVLRLMFDRHTHWHNLFALDALVVLGGLAAFIFGWTKRALVIAPEDALKLTGFLAGAGIYLGTFLMAANWDYRLCFCLFFVPLLAMLGRGSGDVLVSRLATMALWATAGSLWYLVLDTSLIQMVASPNLYKLVTDIATFVSIVFDHALYVLMMALLGMVIRPLAPRLIMPVASV